MAGEERLGSKSKLVQVAMDNNPWYLVTAFFAFPPVTAIIAVS